MNHPTRFCLTLLLAGGMTATLPAQDTPPPPPEISERSPDELDELLGPVALYPDDLVALILPAAAQPTDIVLAARYLENDGAMEEIDEQHWDESVRAVAHFPDVVEWMSKNLAWTQDVGDAFLDQPAEVMKSIQRLRAKAYAAGTLRDTEQQKVLVEGSVIRIVSAEPDVIYVPRYRTEVVYVDRPVYYSEPWITFGIGWRVGSWHRWECDWYSHRVWVFDTHDHWRSRRWHGGFHYVWHPYNYGRAWCPPRTYVRHHHHHRDRDWNRRGDRRVHRPSPYVENESRRRHHNDRDRDISYLDRSRRPGMNRNDGSNTEGSNRDDRRSRTRQGDRRTPDGGNQNVTTNNTVAPTTNTNTAPVRTDSLNRNDRTRSNRSRDITVNRDNDTGRGDRRENSRGSRSSAPANPRPTTVVTAPATPPPAVTTSRSNDGDRLRRNTGNQDRPAYTTRSRQERVDDSGTSRTVRVYAPERSRSTTTSNSGRESRSDTSRSSASSSRNYNNSASASIAPSTTTSSGNNRSNASRSSSESSGRSRDSDSGRSRGSGRNDDGDRGNRSNNGDNGGRRR